ncbi:hypothetical protein ABPG75_007968 [Micractinium tetrahymenae]
MLLPPAPPAALATATAPHAIPRLICWSALQGLKDTVRAVLSGYNGTILAYGQTVGASAARGCCTCTPATVCAVPAGVRQLLSAEPWPQHSPFTTVFDRMPSRPCTLLQGSGKTHTLLGDVSCPRERGVVPRAVAELARGIAEYPEPCKFKAGCCSKSALYCGVDVCWHSASPFAPQPLCGCACLPCLPCMGTPPCFPACRASCSPSQLGICLQVTLSVIEIYLERIKDLLDPSKDNLQVIQDPVRGITVAEATELPVANERDCVELMQRGIAARAVSATAMNAGSSRSHCVVYLVVERSYPDGRTEFGKLCLVDLAGSERQDKTQAVGLTTTEGSQINKSLSALGNVVNTLTDPRGKSHVPYRDSKLTRVLQDSLGGTARTVLIICCSPSQFNDAETLSSLRFGARAKGIQNSVQANAARRTPEQLAKALAAAQAELEALKQQLGQAQDSTGGKASSKAAGSSAAASGCGMQAAAVGAWRGGMGSMRKWALVGALQLAGLVAYWQAAAGLGCAA